MYKGQDTDPRKPSLEEKPKQCVELQMGGGGVRGC